MAYGDITQRGSVSFGTSAMFRTPQMCQANGNYWALVHDNYSAGASPYSILVRTYEIDPDAKTVSALVDSAAVTPAGLGVKLTAPFYQCTKGRDGVIIVWIQDGSNNEWAVSILIDSNGNVLGEGQRISLTTLTYDSLEVATGIIAFCTGGNIQTMSVAANGLIAIIDSASIGAYAIRHHTGDIYVAYSNGTVRTFTIDSSGVIGSVIDTLVVPTWSVSTAYPCKKIAKFGNDLWVVMGRENSTSDGEATTFTIDDDGFIDVSSRTEFNFEGNMAEPCGCIEGSVDGSGNSYVFIGYTDSGIDLRAKGYKITSAGVASYVDGIEWVGSYYIPWILKVSYNLFLIGGKGSGASFAGYLVEMEGIPPPAITSISPAEGKRTRTYDIVISGTNFSGSTGVDFGSGITVDAFAVIDSTEAHVTITIDSDAAEGYYDLTLENPNGDDTLSDAFYVITTEDHYSVQLSGLRIPYIDEDGGKQLHVVLENLDPTTKTEGLDGEVIIDIGYEVAG